MENKHDATDLEALELAACTPQPVNPEGFNQNAVIPYECTIKDIEHAMNDFVDFLGFVNLQLHTKQIPRLESMLMAANFSSIVGEFMISSIPKYCSNLVRNSHHNGHPDLIHKGYYQDDDVLHGDQGIEVKASRYMSGWQGHNREACWLMVFVFNCNGREDIRDESKANPLFGRKQKPFVKPKPFRFVKVTGAQLAEHDWSYSGRSETSRRTITSSVIRTGYEKMMSNWIYQDPLYLPKTRL